MKISDLIANKHIKHFIVGGQQYMIGCHAVDQGEVFVEGYRSPDEALFIVTEDVEPNGDIVQANPLSAMSSTHTSLRTSSRACLIVMSRLLPMTSSTCGRRTSMKGCS